MAAWSVAGKRFAVRSARAARRLAISVGVKSNTLRAQDQLREWAFLDVSAARHDDQIRSK
jgi:hypothetical protein